MDFVLKIVVFNFFFVSKLIFIFFEFIIEFEIVHVFHFFEIVDALFGAVQADKLDNTRAIVLKDNEGTLSLEVATLP